MIDAVLTLPSVSPLPRFATISYARARIAGFRHGASTRASVNLRLRDGRLFCAVLPSAGRPVRRLSLAAAAQSSSCVFDVHQTAVICFLRACRTSITRLLTPNELIKRPAGNT